MVSACARSPVFAAAFAIATAAVFAVLLLEPDSWHALRTFWDRTVGFQLDRESPFSLWGWGQYHAAGIPDLGWLRTALQPRWSSGCAVRLRSGLAGAGRSSSRR